MNILEKYRSKKNIDYKLSINEIAEHMRVFGIQKGDTLLLHSSFKYIDATPEKFIEFLKEYIGDEGNILMPTHPKLFEKNGELYYNPETSPSTVGYLTEIFRKSEGVCRSKHPISSIACWGKDQEYLLKNNLNDNAPLPHGIYSPYYKMSKMNGKVLLIGVTAKKRGTIRHVAEEILDESYPIKDLFLKNEIQIYNDEEYEKKSVRYLNLNKSQVFVAKSKIQKEWLENKILKKSSIKNIPIEYLDAKKCVDYMIIEAKKGNTSYPYAPKKKGENENSEAE